MLLTTIVNIG